MTASDPLILRCIGLTGSFETGLLPPGCFSRLAGDFDGMGISFSALQWNFGQKTLQPLLQQMFQRFPEVMTRCFGELSAVLTGVLGRPSSPAAQLNWARSIQNPNHQFNSGWVTAFSQLGASPAWQAVAMASAEHYFEMARVEAVKLKVSSDRAIALLFDCCVQNGGISELALHHILDTYLESWGEPEKMRCIVQTVARGSNPKWQADVLTRKMAIANGQGKVHGLQFDLVKDFSL